jgi:hypothetical protein
MTPEVEDKRSDDICSPLRFVSVKQDGEQLMKNEIVNCAQTYKVGHVTFIVIPVYRTNQGETVSELLIKLMKAEVDEKKIAS